MSSQSFSALTPARSLLGSVLVVVVGVATACGSSTKDGLGGSPSGTAGATATAGAGGAAGSSGGGAAGASTAGKSGAGGLSVTQVQCGSAVCSSSTDPSVEASACCTAQVACGYRLPISSKCLSTKMPGHVNPVCAPYSIAGKLQLPGCCSPTGCGARVTIMGIGCVANPDLGLDPVACVFETTGTGGGTSDAAAAPADASADAP